MHPPEHPPEFLRPAGSARIVLSTVPAGEAERLAERLVTERLAACVSCLPGVRSVYRWEGAVHNDPETLLLVKTDASRLEALGARLADLHPYDVPELLILGPEGGSAPYLAWLAAATLIPEDPSGR